MKVLIVEPGKYPREADIEHTLEAEQAVVGGTIEAVYPWRDSACIPPPAEYQVDELIAASIESSPVPIQISDSLPDSIQAQYVPKNRTIYVRNGMDAGTTLCAIVRECAQADFHKNYTYNRQAYAAPSYCAAYMVAHRYGLDTTAFNFDRVVALYGNLGKEQQRGFLSDVNTVGGGLLRSLSRTLAVQTRELLAAEYAVAVPSAKKQSRQQERG